ncbi:hypothetical protein [Streptosporangium lutulentum]|uniref:Uncharacterized protein n=1 Tax=Streptosporangium lutulentum TaxID=1461250 RepID=A0ABT9QSW0_9ACTN|nr:hypothetical protein [Streptosporangium lutulentum]MDP9849766.1 hypothetical protein [Streptosporangium lutulentum]
MRLRRALELMIAEVIAPPRYYQALRDRSGDGLTSDVAARIHADERRYLPFHCDRLRDSFRSLPRVVRVIAFCGWWFLLPGVCVVIAVDHGSTLRHLGVPGFVFVLDVVRLFSTVAEKVFMRDGG